MKVWAPIICVLLLAVACSGSSRDERAASGLARRMAPEYASRIVFRQVADTVDSYSVSSRGGRLVIEGSSVNAMAAGLGRYLRDCCRADVSWEKVHPVQLPSTMPLPDSTIASRALVPNRFFLNYCTFGYAMPWWKWEDWEWFIDWMALQGINLPLSITGQEAIWQEVWREFGMSEAQIRSYFTGPAHLPWHRMCNIDGVDGPLPQGWIDSQKELQKRILARERELGMRPVLPAFGGHVPACLKELYPQAAITDIAHWGGFPREYLPHFLSPQDSLFGIIQKKFLDVQSREFGTDHIYGFDLFNEVDPPSWDSGTLAAISREAYGSLAASDPDAVWLQMGWMFWYDRNHWRPEIIEAYLKAVPQGKVCILDYYTETIPVWEHTGQFYGQPYVFCFLGNFGGNTFFSGPMRTESERLTEALSRGGASGIGCTLEGFGLNRWLYEYVLERAWSGTAPDKEWLEQLGRRRHSPAGYWKTMADSVYLSRSISPLVCRRPCMESSQSAKCADASNPGDILVRSWKSLIDAPSSSPAWRFDAVATGSQALSNLFVLLRDELSAAYRRSDIPGAQKASERLLSMIDDLSALTAEEPSLSTDRWMDAAESWARDDAERAYYRRNALHILTTWGYTPPLNDYASRLWSGLLNSYYKKRWSLFTEEVLSCMREGRDYDQQAFNLKAEELENAIVADAGPIADYPASGNLPELCKTLYSKWFDNE